MLTGENVVRIDPVTGTATPLPIEATQLVNTLAERACTFEHRWNLLKKKLLYPDQHGADWDYYRATYRQFLPHITRDYDS